MGNRVATCLIQWRYLLLLSAAILAALAIAPAQKLDFDRSIENMFAEDDPLLPPYQLLKRTFGGNEIVMAVYHDPDLLNESGEGIRRLRDVSQELAEVPGIKEVLSLAELDDALSQLHASIQDELNRLPLAGRVVVRQLGLDNVTAKSITQRDSPLAGRFRKLFEGFTHGKDQQTAAIACMLAPKSESSVPRRQTLSGIRQVVAGLPDGFPDVMLTGEPVMVIDGFQHVEDDGRRLGWVSTILLAITIAICFRSLRWVVIPILVVQLTLILTRATLVWSGFEMSMVSSMLTAIVTVIGVATVVHIIVRYREGRLRLELTPRTALHRAGVLLAAPIFFACMTDAVGFLSLLVTNVGPVRDFGVMMAIGSVTVLLAVGLLVPGLALWKIPERLRWLDAEPQTAWHEATLDRQLVRAVKLVQKSPGIVGAISTVCAVLLAIGITKIEVESDFTKNYREDSPLVQSYQFVEDNLGGAGVWDVVLPAPEQLNWPYLRSVLKLEEELRQLRIDDTDSKDPQQLTKVLSLADAVAASSPLDLSNSLLPSLVREPIIARIVREMQASMPAFTAALHGEDPQHPGRYYLRIMLRAKERQSSSSKRVMIDQVSKTVQRNLETAAWQEQLALLQDSDDKSTQAYVTGFFVLLTNLIDSMLADQWLAFAVAAGGIALMMLVAFRNPLLALVALVPNVVPIIMVLGLLGWLGLKINMGAAMIAAVSMGLSIDSSIHYITAFRRDLQAGRSVAESLFDVQQRVGRALFFSTIALIVGFISLCISEFVPTIYFGVLVSLSMLGGLLGNLVVLPLLLSLVSRDRTPESPS